MNRIIAQSLTRDVFAEYGDVLDMRGAPPLSINSGMTERYHDLAKVEAAGPGARVLLSIFHGKPYSFPLKLKMVERHPFGSQAFMPLSQAPFLVVVCHEGEAGPDLPRAFITRPGQGVSYPRNLWHAVLTPIGAPQDFLVVDRGGDGNNVEEFHFSMPYEIQLPEVD